MVHTCVLNVHMGAYNKFSRGKFGANSHFFFRTDVLHRKAGVHPELYGTRTAGSWVSAGNFVSWLVTMWTVYRSRPMIGQAEQSALLRIAHSKHR